MGTWLKHSDYVAALLIGNIGYGCTTTGGLRFYNSLTAFLADVPDQAKVDADEAACNAASANADPYSPDTIALVADTQITRATATLLPQIAAATAAAATASNSANQALAAAQTTLAPIPIAIMTADYSALIDDQRICHDSATTHTLTPQPASAVPFRRFVFGNGLAGGNLILAGQYLTPTATGTPVVTNYVIPPGGSVDVISRWVPYAQGTTPPPDGLRYNGGTAPNGSTGVWMYDVVAVNRGSPTAAEFANLVNSVAAIPAAPVSSVNGKTGSVVLTSSDVGAQPAGAYATTAAMNTAIGAIAYPVTSVAGKTGAVTLSASDVGAQPTGSYATTTQLSAAIAGIPAAPVQSVNGLTGAVVLPIPTAPAADPVPATAGLRTLGTGAQQAAPGNHSHSAATTGLDGFLSAADKATLNALAASGSQVATLTTNASGIATWTFPTPFGTGVVPNVQGIAITAVSTSQYNVQLASTPTNTTAVFKVNVTSGTTVNLVGLTSLTLFTPAPAGVTIMVFARAP